MRHKVFVSHHHGNDQRYKDALVEFGEKHDIFLDQSVDTGEIDDDLPDERIREKIRDEYLRDSTVTIVLVGTETKRRKHIDWEIYSSMFDGRVNKRSGILVVNLPTIDREYVCWAPHGAEEKRLVYPGYTNWQHWSGRGEFEEKFPYMPSRITDSLVKGVKISVTHWGRLTPERLRFLIDAAFSNRRTCDYDLSAPMRRMNS